MMLPIAGRSAGCDDLEVAPAGQALYDAVVSRAVSDAQGFGCSTALRNVPLEDHPAVKRQLRLEALEFLKTQIWSMQMSDATKLKTLTWLFIQEMEADMTPNERLKRESDRASYEATVSHHGEKELLLQRYDAAVEERDSAAAAGIAKEAMATRARYQKVYSGNEADFDTWWDENSAAVTLSETLRAAQDVDANRAQFEHFVRFG